MAKIYYDQDADLSVLKNKTVAIVGYGIQGRGQALNLRDSGVKVVVAQRKGGANYDQAVADGFEPVDAPAAAKQADIIQMLTQDHLQPALYEAHVKDNLTEGKALLFSHGFNIHYQQIVPPKNVDVLMIAPKAPGKLVREMFEKSAGVPALLAIYQDHTGNAKSIGLAYAKAIGTTRAGLIETTFAEETETDLFGEQSVLCGGVSELIRAGFDTLVAAGYQPEIAYFECCHELKLIMDLIYEAGISGMRKRVSDTAEYGDITRGRRVINQGVRETMKQILHEVQSGEFAREWVLENRANRPVYNALTRQDQQHLIEKVGAELRQMMPWMRK